MKVTEKDVTYVADLANLELTPDEQTRMVKDLNSILEHFDRLNQLDTSNIAPMSQTSEYFDIANQSPSERVAHAYRDDVVVPSLDRAEVMKIAPNSDSTFFLVPKVIER